MPSLGKEHMPIAFAAYSFELEPEVFGQSCVGKNQYNHHLQFPTWSWLGQTPVFEQTTCARQAASAECIRMMSGCLSRWDTSSTRLFFNSFILKHKIWPKTRDHNSKLQSGHWSKPGKKARTTLAFSGAFKKNGVPTYVSSWKHFDL